MATLRVSRLTHLESLDISLEDELEVAEDDEFATVLAAAAISAVVVVQCRKEEEEQEVTNEC